MGLSITVSTMISWFSGSHEARNRAHAGVGFWAGPSAVNSAIASEARDDRVAALRVEISGGVLPFISACAPHSGLECEVRQDSRAELQSRLRATTAHSATYILGDFNALLLRVGPGAGQCHRAARVRCSTKGRYYRPCQKSGAHDVKQAVAGGNM
eukprot:1910084-Pyramimonas_sp.AAC.1